MSATTTQLLSSGEFCELRYATIPVKSAPKNVSFYTSNSKMPILSCDTLVANKRYVKIILKVSYFIFRPFSKVWIIISSLLYDKTVCYDHVCHGLPI